MSDDFDMVAMEAVSNQYLGGDSSLTLSLIHIYPVKMYLSDMYTVAVNLAGLPAIRLPVKLDEKGMPIGLQFIGDSFQEKKVLQAARGLEAIRGEFPLAGRKEEG